MAGSTLNPISIRQNDAITAVQNAQLSDRTKRRYTELLAQFAKTGGRLTDAAAVRDFARSLSSDSARRQFKAAIGVYGRQLAHNLKADATPDAEHVAMTQAALWRIEAMSNAFTVADPEGERAHRWLTPVQQRHLLMLPDRYTLKGRRDDVLLRLLLGAGLRRNEAAALTYDHIVMMGDAPVLELTAGTKRGKSRLVPIGRKLAALLSAWHETTGPGRVVRNVNRGRLGSAISGTSILRTVKSYGAAIDAPDLAPHDLRRTFAENLRQNGADLVTISAQLGHKSLETTQRYLNVAAGLGVVGADFLPW